MRCWKRPSRVVGLLAGAAAGLLVLNRWKKKRHQPAAGYRNTAFWHLYDASAQWADHRYGWDKLPTPIGIAVLLGLRNILRQHNLVDTTSLPASNQTQPGPFDPTLLTSRSGDGSYNDLSNPTMGMQETRFGRNIPLDHIRSDVKARLLEPNPRAISNKLMVRTKFIPATSVNVIAATWIQFMVKDWFSHGAGDPASRWEIALDPGDGWPQPPLTILKTQPDPTRPEGSTAPKTFLNVETHWWDGSQIYGNTVDQQMQRRTGAGGKLIIGPDGLLAIPDDPKTNPALVPGWWLGLNMMATVFVREHNAICDALAADYPNWNDEELFQRARLINAALMAKIHTVEWTPALINHPTTVLALNINWWGAAGEKVRKTLGRISKDEFISGIVGSRHDHYGVPYALTEEFSIVYRMHPLVPDDYEFRSASGDGVIGQRTLPEITGLGAQEATRAMKMSDIFYSFGTSYPGAITLHNFPRGLQQFRRPDSDVLMDIAATDIVRSRELGVPRYNEFRRLLHMKPASNFEELTGGNAALAAEIRQVYDGDIESVDTIVGMFSEPLPKGFAFSDTAFRIFILMASRRLNSDRFLADHFNSEVYTRTGIDWVQNNTFVDVLLRHYPELRPALKDVTNAFQPWARTVPPTA